MPCMVRGVLAVNGCRVRERRRVTYSSNVGSNVLGQLVNALWLGVGVFNHLTPDRGAVKFAGDRVLAAVEGHYEPGGWL